MPAGSQLQVLGFLPTGEGAHRLPQHPPPFVHPHPNTGSGNGNGPVLSLLSYCFKESGETFFNIPVSIKNELWAVPYFQNWEKKGKVLGGGYLQIRLHCPATTMSLQQAAFLYRDVSETQQNMILRNRGHAMTSFCFTYWQS